MRVALTVNGEKHEADVEPRLLELEGRAEARARGPAAAVERVVAGQAGQRCATGEGGGAEAVTCPSALSPQQ